MGSTLPSLTFMQAGYVVNDVEEACRRFHQQLRIGPFFLFENYQVDAVYYAEPPMAFRLAIDVALAQSGDLQIELMKPRTELPTAFSDVFAPGQQGLHHMAAFSADYEADRQRYLDAGYRLSMDVHSPHGYTIGLIDTVADFGHMIELYPEVAPLRQLQGMVRERSAAWNGKDLITAL